MLLKYSKVSSNHMPPPLWARSLVWNCEQELERELSILQVEKTRKILSSWYFFNIFCNTFSSLFHQSLPLPPARRLSNNSIRTAHLFNDIPSLFSDRQRLHPLVWCVGRRGRQIPLWASLSKVRAAHVHAHTWQRWERKMLALFYISTVIHVAAFICERIKCCRETSVCKVFLHIFQP